MRNNWESSQKAITELKIYRYRPRLKQTVWSIVKIWNAIECCKLSGKPFNYEVPKLQRLQYEKFPNCAQTLMDNFHMGQSVIKCLKQPGKASRLAINH
jgi:hypothetical protein